MYRNLGLRLQAMDNPAESGTLNLGQRMGSGRLKVFPSLAKYLEERRLYRRDEKDQIVKDRDNLQVAARCLVSGASRMSTQPKPAPAWPPRTVFGERGWMS